MQNWRVNKKWGTNLEYFFHTCKIVLVLCACICLNNLLSSDLLKVARCTFVEMSRFVSVLASDLFFHKWINYVLVHVFLFSSLLPSSFRAFNHFFFPVFFLSWLLVCLLVSFSPLTHRSNFASPKSRSVSVWMPTAISWRWTLLTDLTSPLRSVMHLFIFSRILEISTVFLKTMSSLSAEKQYRFF